jgi:Collagen triple helix repeat (20 copies)
LNRVSLRIGVFATVAALGALLLSTAGPASAAKPFGKDSVIYACVKAKGKSKGTMRVVTSKRGCRKMRGWRPLSWSANGSSGASGQVGSEGTRGQQGEPGPEGKQGQQGAAGQVEKTLTETVQSQATQINALSAEVTDLTGEVLGLEGDLSELTGDLGGLEGTVGSLSGDLTDIEGTVSETCDQLTQLTTQADEILDSLLGSSVAILGNLLNVPSPPDPLGTFECT